MFKAFFIMFVKKIPNIQTAKSMISGSDRAISQETTYITLMVAMAPY